MTDFKVGDKVRRIKCDNGEGACVGTIATVTKVYEDGDLNVYYPGCLHNYEDGSEFWCACFAELFQEPQHEHEHEPEHEPGKDKEESVNTNTLQNAYVALQEASGIKVGDTVRVLRKAGSGEMGWTTSWSSYCMDRYVGETGVVEELAGSDGIQVSFSGDTLWWSFPFFVLEKIAPRFIMINGFEVPEPVREPLKKGEGYWVTATLGTYYHYYIWDGGEFVRRMLQRGLIHKTQEAAEIHAKALLSFTMENHHANP